MSAYLWIMAAGSALIFALYGLRCARARRVPGLRRPWLTALLGFVFSAVFGTVLARVGYALLTQELDFEYDGLAALEDLLEFRIDSLSFFFGALGVILGVLLANRICRRGAVLAGMDAFAPFGALLSALFRLGELFHGSYGVGSNLPEGSAFAVFPFAVKITSAAGVENWAWAVCVLSAAFAFAWAVYALLWLRARGRSGLLFTVTLFFLALRQILCESLRTRGIHWLFVHTEQLLCAIVLLGLILFWILASRRGPVLRRWWPLAVLLVGAGALVALEFAIVDGKYINLPRPVSYLLMCVVLAAYAFAGFRAARRWNREPR